MKPANQIISVMAFMGMILMPHCHAEAPGIWGKGILLQPFEKQPFHEIAIPKWLEETTLVTYCLSGMDAAGRDRAKAHGAQISELGFADPWFVYFDSQILKKRSPHVPADRVETEIAEYRKRGIRILGVVPPGLQSEIYAEHPDWRQISTNTTDIPAYDPEKNPLGGGICLLGPWGDRLIDLLCEIQSKYPVDAWSFDGLHHGGGCYCQHCRENYRKDTGKEIPNPNMDDPAFRHYLTWANRRLEELLIRMQTRLKAINPDVALVSWSTNAGRWGHFLSIPRNMPARLNLLLDAPDQEFWMDETNQGNTVVPAFGNAYMWAVTNHRVAFSSPYLFTHGNPYGHDSMTPTEILMRAMLVLTWGPRPSMALAPPQMLEAVYAALDEIKKRETYLTCIQPEHYIGVVMSDNTNCFYGRSPGAVEERYLSHVLGMFRMGIEEHLGFTVINDWNLTREDLTKYKVLILPNTACLDKTQIEAIREFVRDGGGLVASGDTSLFDELGDPHPDYSLADVFGVKYLGIPVGEGGRTEAIDVNFLKGINSDYWLKRKNIFDLRLTEKDNVWRDERLKTYLADQPVVFKGQAVSVQPASPEARVLATLATRVAAPEPIPAVVSNVYGKGKVIFFAAGIDSAYYLYSYPYHRLLLKDAVNWVAPSPFGIQVEAPMSVQSTFYRQTRDGERLLVHLYNGINSTANHAKSADDVPIREEVIPIHNIRVKFKGYAIKKFHLEPEGETLPSSQEGDEVTVVVPRLDIHSIVVAEL